MPMPKTPVRAPAKTASASGKSFPAAPRTLAQDHKLVRVPDAVRRNPDTTSIALSLLAVALAIAILAPATAAPSHAAAILAPATAAPSHAAAVPSLTAAVPDSDPAVAAPAATVAALATTVSARAAAVADPSSTALARSAAALALAAILVKPREVTAGAARLVCAGRESSSARRNGSVTGSRSSC